MKNNVRRVLVTGAAGFVGRHLIAALIKDGWLVKGTGRGERPSGEGWNPVEWVPCDLAETRNFSHLLSGVDAVIHLSALAHQIGTERTSADYLTANTEVTKRLAAAASRAPNVRRFLFVSTVGAICSASDEVISEKSPCQPDTPYGQSKLRAEEALAEELNGSAADWCVIRPTLVYGPGNPGNMERLIKLIKLPLPLPFGAIRNRRSFVYVGNLVDAIQTCLTKPEASRKTFVVADREVLSTGELIRELAKACGRSVRLVSVPLGLLRVGVKLAEIPQRITGRSFGLDLKTLEKLSDSLEVSTAKIEEEVGWQPPFTAREGLRRTFEPKGERR